MLFLFCLKCFSFAMMFICFSVLNPASSFSNDIYTVKSFSNDIYTVKFNACISTLYLKKRMNFYVQKG